MSRNKLPSHNQLLLPLLQTLQEQGGSAKPSNLYPALEERFDIDTSEVEKFSKTDNRFRHRVRWVRQHALRDGLIKSPSRNLWELTDYGDQTIGKVRPGLIFTIFETPNGTALWARAEDAAGVIQQKSIQLVYTSPPYPLIRPKEYGNLSSKDHVNWITELADMWKPLLRDDRSLVLNLGPTGVSGLPTQDPYIERIILKLIDTLGYHLMDRFVWHNPVALPSPKQWVAINRVRMKSAHEAILWFSPTGHPRANNKNDLKPYSQSTIDRAAAIAANNPDWAQTTQIRPSGQEVSPNIYKGAVLDN